MFLIFLQSLKAIQALLSKKIKAIQALNIVDLNINIQQQQTN
jgi:hypothetical protein